MIGRQEHMRELAFQRVNLHVAPRWPAATRPQQLHLDIAVEEFEPAIPVVRALVP